MATKTTLTVSRLFGRLGTCPRCMRTSFQVAAASWAGVIVAEMLRDQVAYYYATHFVAFGIAGAATLIWLMHVFVFATRVGISAIKNTDQTLSSRAQHRRQFIRKFGYSLGAIILITALPTAAYAGYACGQ